MEIVIWTARAVARWECLSVADGGNCEMVFVSQHCSDLGLIMNALPNNVTALNDGKFSAPRIEGGRFAKGGPGRPVGSRNRVSGDVAKQIAALGPRAVAALAEALDERPVPAWAVQCVFKYVAPGRLIELFGCTPEDLRQSFCDGQITADELNSAASAVEKLKRVESAEIVEQLARINAKLDQYGK